MNVFYINIRIYLFVRSCNCRQYGWPRSGDHSVSGRPVGRHVVTSSRNRVRAATGYVKSTNSV